MAGNSQKYNASINFGASVDPSMSRTLNRMTAGIDDIGTETAKVARTQSAWQRQMKAGSASTVNQIQHMERATQALLSKQEALEKEIRESVKNGRAGTAFLIADYKKVGAGIERAREEMERLNAEQKREEKLDAWNKRREARWDRLNAAPMKMVKSGLDVGAKVIGLGTAGVTGLIGGVLALNHKTAEEYRLSKQYGMSFQHYKAGSILAEQAGLNGENFGDLSEELSNKLGEVGNDKTINPMLAQIGLNKHLSGTKQEQFDTVMQKISKAVLVDKKMTAQQGESLADQLMGGEANKLMTYIISTGKSYEEVMRNAAQLNNITEEEARGAMESSMVISNMWTSAETALQGMAGELGSALEPQLKAWEQDMTEWVRNNKDQIAKSIGSWVDGGGPQRLVDGLETFGRALAQIVKWIDAVIPESDERTPEQMDSAQEARQRAIEVEEQKQGVNSLDYQESIAVANAGEKAWKDARSQARVPDNVTFDSGTFGIPIPSSKTVAPQQTNHVSISVTAAPGQSPEDIGMQVYQKFNDAVPDLSSDPGGSDTFDQPLF
ncbi:hypothetical protein I7V28_01365 [Lelliottia amnigena]|uniref:hypothetical protein n=1 Tax=Lelliottia amnigena TaxID=61646 RepID=UPI00192CCA61|nr:hypothetical protein [Lelliottia amnigena]MBL5919783.1 hypothetical protein [Lelliottia amnigena]